MTKKLIFSNACFGELTASACKGAFSRFFFVVCWGGVGGGGWGGGSSAGGGAVWCRG